MKILNEILFKNVMDITIFLVSFCKFILYNTEFDVFKYDLNFEENEAQYDEIRREIIGDADDSDEDDEEGGGGEQPAAATGEDGEA